MSDGRFHLVVQAGAKILAWDTHPQSLDVTGEMGLIIEDRVIGGRRIMFVPSGNDTEDAGDIPDGLPKGSDVIER